LIEHVGVAAVRDRAPGETGADQRRGEHISDGALGDQVASAANGRGETALEPDRGADTRRTAAHLEVDRLGQTVAQRPLAKDHLAGGERGGDELVMVRHLDRDDHEVDPGVSDHLTMIVEARHTERRRSRFSGFPPARADRGQFIVGDRGDRREMGRHRPPLFQGARPDHPDADLVR
jgi:hypothetical protein